MDKVQKPRVSDRQNPLDSTDELADMIVDKQFALFSSLISQTICPNIADQLLNVPYNVAVTWRSDVMLCHISSTP
jgi:hypothetical protein